MGGGDLNQNSAISQSSALTKNCEGQDCAEKKVPSGTYRYRTATLVQLKDEALKKKLNTTGSFL
jgi:hypothetical protein